MREAVSLKKMRATFNQHGGDGGLAAGDAASKSYAQHWRVHVIEKLEIEGDGMSPLALTQYIQVISARHCLPHSDQPYRMPAAQLSCFHCVAHQHGDSEWAYSTGDGCDGSCDFGNLGVNIAHKS
jgi:hypothetical protein